MRSIVAFSLALPLALTAVPALAQNSPSASQIIQSLKPSGNLTAGGTRGIRLVAPGASPAQPAALRQAPARVPGATHASVSAAVPSAPAVNLTVDFATGSAVLTPQAKRTLDQLGKALSSQDLSRYRFRIEGHTDTVGTEPANLSLSQQRAAAVAAYLEHTYAITPSRLQPVGMGEQGLLVPTPPQTPNAANRRVEVINLGA